jgi:hypothetical protein
MSAMGREWLIAIHLVGEHGSKQKSYLSHLLDLTILTAISFSHPALAK